MPHYLLEIGECMKTLIFILAGLSMASTVAGFYLSGRLPLPAFITASSESLEEAQSDTLAEHVTKHADPNYVCPMHSQIVQNEEGSCPICGMDLVLKEPAPTETSQEKKILYWVAPMDANYRRDEPGQSPMGMDLVPVYDEGQSGQQDDEFPAVTVNATTAQNMGIRIHKVARSTLDQTIHTIGRIQYNEDTLQHVHPRANGWVEKVRVKAEGDHVKQGQILLEYYAPDMVAAQQDYLLSKKSSDRYSVAGSATLLSSAKQRLALLDIPSWVIEKLDSSGEIRNRMPVASPQKGVITAMGIRDGMYVTPATEMYSIADLSTVWVLVDIFEHQMSWINTGNKAVITVEGLPGERWEGMVDYIYPELDKTTRTLRIRLKFDTPEQKLKPNMFSRVTVTTQNKETLSVPAEAIIYYANKPRIIKRTNENTFQPVEVSLGIRSDGNVEVLKGLAVGDEIVASGQFMLDSESNLQASFRRLSE
jgi:Cu(I)/Ag(I) efflux system membrane fusion protein